MYTMCRDLLLDCVTQAGLKKTQIYTSRKKLSLCYESRVGAVLFEDDVLTIAMDKRIYTDDSGKHKRKKKYSRILSFSIVLGEYDIEKVQELYDAFLDALPQGIYVNGNYVAIEPEQADWVDDEDTILKSKCAVQVKVNFKGGVYMDTDYARVTEVDIVVEKE